MSARDEVLGRIRGALGAGGAEVEVPRAYRGPGAGAPAGAPIARMGSSGCSTGPHLHLTVRTPDGREINPFTVLEP